MNKRSTKFFLPTLFCISLSSLSYPLTPETITVLAPKEVKESDLPKKESPYRGVPASLKTTTGQKIWFKFKDEPLIDVVHYIASAKNINVVLPQGQDVLTTKITYQFPDKISVEQAYEKLLSILKLAGYLFVPQGEFHYIIKNDKDLNKQTLPLYINTPPSDLPDVDQMIRYVYYFANIQVPPSSSGGGGGFGGSSSGNALQTFLTDTLSKTFVYMVDPNSNGIIMTDYARNIRSIMEIVKEIDSHGFTDSIEIMPLTHTDATTITSLLMTQLITSAASSGGQGGFGQPIASQATPSTSSYFTPTTKVVAETRSNSLIIMGKKDAIIRIKEFVKKYIDVPLDSGDSILHIYPLQYLNAQTFAPILTQIVNSQSGGSSNGGGFGGTTGQSAGTANALAGKQYFKGVIIQAEIVAPVATAAPTSTSSSTTSSGTAPQAAQQGGNRLIIAALREDWARLKKLISDLDRPQPQVAIEMLIVDFTLTGAQALGSQVRNKQGMLPRGVFAQNSTLGPIQFNNPSNPAFDGLMSNLLQVPDANGNNLVGGNAPQGTFVLSLQDNANTGIAWVMEALLSYTNVTILSHPFTVTLNNQPTSFTDNQTLLLPGSATVKKGATYVPIAPVTAALQLNITPMINGENYINLGLNVQVSEFSTGNSQICRNIQTNANVKDGQVLILGGLTKTTTATANLATPGLENIPIIGWLFKQKTKGVIKSNLAVFICPRILQSTNGYCDPFTAEKFSIATDSVNLDKNFTALRDPITRWFFGSAHEITNEQKVSDYINRKQFVTEQNYKKTKLIAHTEETKQLLPTPPLPLKKETPSKGASPLKLAQASPKKNKETIILTTKNSTEQAELKRLFSTFSQTNSMHDLATQTKVNLL
jgi:general secretion pathway protein D